MAILLRELDYVGTEISLRFTIGQLLDIALEFKNDDGTVVNVTGRTYTCEIGLEGSASIVDFVQVLTDPINGLINLTLDTSTGIAAGNYKWIAWEQGNNQLWQGPVEVIDPIVT